MVEDNCWICLQEGGSLHFPCKCPRQVHSRCLASWQLYRAGTREETECRFCYGKLPDWRASLCPKPEAFITPIVAVVYEGQEYRFSVEPTPEGQKKFTRDVEALIGHSLELHEIRFHCRGPSGNHLQLRGLQSLDAAVHCAAATAAERSAQLESLISATTASDYNLLWHRLPTLDSRIQEPRFTDSSSGHGVDAANRTTSSSSTLNSSNQLATNWQQHELESAETYPTPVYNNVESNSSSDSRTTSHSSTTTVFSSDGSHGADVVRQRQTNSASNPGVGTAVPGSRDAAAAAERSSVSVSGPLAAAVVDFELANSTRISTVAAAMSSSRPAGPIPVSTTWNDRLQATAGPRHFNFLPGAIVELRDQEGAVQQHASSSCVFGWLSGLLRALLNH